MFLGIAGCASIGTPQGGPKDETPPVLVKSKPVANATQWKKKKIEIEFDELVSVQSANEKVVISPPQKKPAIVSGIMNTVRVELQDSLLPNTTYTIDFSDAIVDYNESNPYGQYSFAFSTGDSIDSLCVSGHVLDAATLSPKSGIIVGAHANLHDSAFQKEKFLRIAKTDDKGHFVLRGMKHVPYHIFALGDQNRDYMFDQKGEGIAFLDSAVHLWTEICQRPDTLWQPMAKGDTTRKVDTIVMRDITCFKPDSLLLMYFNEDFGRQYLAKSERKEANKIVLYFGFKADTLPSLQLLVADSIEHQDDWYVLEDNPTHDTLTYWIKDSSLIKLDTIALRVDYLKTDSNDLLSPTCDTLQVVFKKEKAKSGKKNAQDNKRNNRRGRKNEKDIEQKNDTIFRTDTIVTPLYDAITEANDSLFALLSSRIEREALNDSLANSLTKDSIIVLNDSIFAKNDTIFVWLKNDTVFKHDTILPPAKKPEVKHFKLTAKLGSDIHVYAVPTFTWEYPVAHDSIEAWHLYQKVDTTWKELHNFDLEQDLYNPRVLHFYGDWDYEESYKIELDSGAYRCIYDSITNNKFSQEFKVKAEKDYSRLTVNIIGLEASQTAFVEVLNSSDKVIHQEPVIDGVADCLNMPATDVYLRLIIDTNDDFLWTTGAYEEKRQPEQVFYLNKKLTLKANWEIQETWNIRELPFENQKPKELIKKEDKKR